MNIIEAINITKNSPNKVAKELQSFIYGFKDRRDVSYFDLFLFYPFFSYKPSHDFFNKQMRLSNKNKVNFFIENTSLQPEIFASIKFDFYETIYLTKEAIIYGINNKYFLIDDKFIISLNTKHLSNKNRVSENIGKFLSTQSTAYLYKYFKVDIDAI